MPTGDLHPHSGRPAAGDPEPGGGGCGGGGGGQGGSQHGVQEASQAGRHSRDQWSSRGGGRLPPLQEGNIQAPDHEAKNSQLQGESGLGVGSWRLLKIVSDSEPRAGGTGPAPSSPGPSPLEAPHRAKSWGRPDTGQPGDNAGLRGGKVPGTGGENRPQISVWYEVSCGLSVCPDPEPESEETPWHALGVIGLVG